MRRKTIKVGTILLYYSFAVTGLLILMFIVFISSISIPETDLPKQLFILEEYSNVQFTNNGGIEKPFNFRFASTVSKTSLEEYYLGALLGKMPGLVVCIIGIIVIGTFLLSKILKNHSEKQALFLAVQLAGIDEENITLEQHPAVVKAYQAIKSRLEAYALDYVRLSTYVTHEQKNILSLLRAKLQLSENAELTAEVDKVTDSLDDILTLSASKNRVELELVDAALVCADVCDDYRKIFSQLKFDFDDEASYLIHSRNLWISRAVSNLISNAVKYGGNGEIRVVVTNKKGSVIIAVSDEGEGIDTEAQKKLFDYQYRVGELKKDGYGIGLSLVRHVCELCDGLCWVESGIGKGTTFYMVFPEAGKTE